MWQILVIELQFLNVTVTKLIATNRRIINLCLVLYTNYGSAVICTQCVCMYTKPHNQQSLTCLLLKYLTVVYPIIQKVNSMKTSQILHPPFCHQTVMYREPSKPLHPPSCPQNLNPSNHHNNYIHCPALTRLTAANHHNHSFHCPALTQLTDKTIKTLTATVLP